MKLRLRRQDIIYAINFYNENLVVQYGPRALTYARKELINIGFEKLRTNKQKFEKTNVWYAPFYVRFEDNGAYTVDIDENDKRILIMDW